jgi:hypothetical protein
VLINMDIKWRQKLEAVTPAIAILSLIFSCVTGITFIRMNYYSNQISVSNIQPVYFEQPARFINGTLQNIVLLGEPEGNVQLTFSISIVSPYVGNATIEYVSYSIQTGSPIDFYSLMVSNLVLSVPSGAYQNTVSIPITANIRHTPTFHQGLSFTYVGTILMRVKYQNVQWIFPTPQISSDFVVPMYWHIILS